ncbi:hypothetical protein AMTR_s00020p00248390 [Amborella trichopoda]|uniref:Uncharacterized protein n=1 Tax=Amborella trichopoda TaxID=13333 RepID=W1PVS9_AMBTC|nr:hypothetical protein AMTR_s00020p00248390 [Amborella trichopoda]
MVEFAGRWRTWEETAEERREEVCEWLQMGGSGCRQVIEEEEGEVMAASGGYSRKRMRWERGEQRDDWNGESKIETRSP